jgi:hypothetical protein
MRALAATGARQQPRSQVGARHRPGTGRPWVQAAAGPAHLPLRLAVQRAGGLVKQQHCWGLEEGPGDGHSLLLACSGHQDSVLRQHRCMRQSPVGCVLCCCSCHGRRSHSGGHVAAAQGIGSALAGVTFTATHEPVLPAALQLYMQHLPAPAPAPAALTSTELQPPLTHHGVIAIRHAQDGVMDAGSPGGSLHLLTSGTLPVGPQQQGDAGSWSGMEHPIRHGAPCQAT